MPISTPANALSATLNYVNFVPQLPSGNSIVSGDLRKLTPFGLIAPRLNSNFAQISIKTCGRREGHLTNVLDDTQGGAGTS